MAVMSVATRTRVARSGRIAQVDRCDGGLDETLEDVLDLRMEFRVLNRHRGLAGQRAGETHLAIGVWQHVPIGVLLVRDSRARVCLTVDEQQHAHQMIATVEHGDDQHRLV